MSIRIVILVLVVAAAVGVALMKRTDAGASADPSGAPAGSAAERSGGSAPQPLPRLVSLGAGKCIPCKAMEPTREALISDYADRLRVQYHDVWQDPQAAQRYGIRLIPTLIYFDAQGRELGRTEGYQSKRQILDAFARWGVDLRDASGSGAETGS